MTNFKNRSHTSVFALQNSKLAKKEMAQKNSHELRTDDLTLLPRGVSLDDPCLCVHHYTGIMSHPPETKETLSFLLGSTVRPRIALILAVPFCSPMDTSQRDL
jgi:hypothetical protein